MTKATKLIGSLSDDFLFQAVGVCAQLPAVREQVIRNHDNNQWWPLNIEDWRLRMIIAGWSSRVSYNMISTYQRVVSNINEIGYTQLRAMSDDEVKALVSSLGLISIRVEYLRSLGKFLDNLHAQVQNPLELPNDHLIVLLANNVKGASYKVAQCATLYAKGYHCGIFPVDSGMKDMLGPCLGLQLPKGAVAHEIMRKHIEGLLNAKPHKYYKLAQATGYDGLAIPKDKSPIWWVHLVLIYFKRLYCNKHNPSLCPLRISEGLGKNMGAMCHKHQPYSGGYRYIVLEGVDRTGKSTIAEALEQVGYNIVHSTYNPRHTSISQHYASLIDNASTPVVFDRSFISEMTYGDAIREHSRLSESEFDNLLKLLSAKGCLVLYLKESTQVIQERLQASSDEHSSVLLNLDALQKSYDVWMQKVAAFLPVHEITTTDVPKEQMISHILRVIES